MVFVLFGVCGVRLSFGSVEVSERVNDTKNGREGEDG